MAASPNEPPDNVKKLPRRERAELALLLVRSLHEGVSEDIDDVWAAEIDNRSVCEARGLCKRKRLLNRHAHASPHSVCIACAGLPHLLWVASGV